MIKVLIVGLLAIVASGCASPRCTVQGVPMHWVDGSVSLMTIQTCRYGVNHPAKP